MTISDPILNCALGVCCPPAQAQAAFAKAMVEEGCCSEADAKTVAAWVFEYFDLAPHGTLADFKAEVARLARANAKKA